MTRYMCTTLICGIAMLAVAIGSASAKEKPEDIIKYILTSETDSAAEKPKFRTPTRSATAKPSSTKPSEQKQKKQEKLAPGSPEEVIYKTAIQLGNASHNEAALSKFAELKSKYPQSVYRDSASVWSGRIHLRLRNVAAALKEFESIAESSGEYPAALFYLGRSHAIQGARTKAIEHYFKLATQFPDVDLADNALIELSQLYLDDGRGAQALEMAAKVIRQYPDRDTIDEAYYLVGKIFERDPVLKDIETARKMYQIFLRKAQRKDPHFAQSPLRRQVARDLKNIERIYFNLEN